MTMAQTPTSSLPLTPLSEGELSPAVQRAIGPAAPAQVRQMAARGLAPLPPPELLTALYQISLTGDATLRYTATETAGALPDPVLRAGLLAPQDPRVLDFLARHLYQRREALDLVLQHRALDDRTVEFLAIVCEEDALEQIAKYEQRLLRSPAIIAALYMNPRTRASTAMRAVELAARNQVVVDIPGYEDVVASLHGVSLTAEDDARFREVIPPDAAAQAQGEALVGEGPAVTLEEIEKIQREEEATLQTQEAEQKKQRFEDMPVPFQIRAATLGNAFDRSVAIRSTVRLVCMAAIKSPALTINEVTKFASNRALHQDVITYIANKKEWVQLSAVRLALVNNNKCPLGTAMRFLNFLNARDLKAIARSKNVPGPLVKAAKELIAKRERK
jgi:hypothetical protein